MPNYAKQEREVLSGDQLQLAEKSRQPALGALSDSQLYDLLRDLRQASGAAGEDTGGDGSPARFLRAAGRRVDEERRKRGLPTRPKAKQTGAQPVVKTPASPAKPAGSKRKPATLPRTPAGRKPAEARKTDLRTEPHRIPKRRAKATEGPAPLAAGSEQDAVPPAAEPETGKAARQAARKADNHAARAAEKEAAKAERKAGKAAAKAARKTAEKAAKEQEKAAAKALRKATKDEQKKRAKEERKAAKAARRAQSSQDPDGRGAKADKPKTGKTS